MYSLVDAIRRNFTNNNKFPQTIRTERIIPDINDNYKQNVQKMYRVSTSTLRSSNVAITFILISRVSVSNDYFNTTQFCKQKKLTLLLLASSALNVNVLIKTGFVKIRIIHNDKQYMYFKILIGSSLHLNICAPV